MCTDIIIMIVFMYAHLYAYIYIYVNIYLSIYLYTYCMHLYIYVFIYLHFYLWKKYTVYILSHINIQLLKYCSQSTISNDQGNQVGVGWVWEMFLRNLCWAFWKDRMLFPHVGTQTSVGKGPLKCKGSCDEHVTCPHVSCLKSAFHQVLAYLQCIHI